MPASPFHHILVAWDASPDAHVALELALRLASANRGTVTAVSVLDPGIHTETVGAQARAVDPIRTGLENAIAAHRTDATSAGVTLSHLLIEASDRSDALLSYANRHAADLLVVGRRGNSGRLHAHLGPVAARLAADGHLPVMVTGQED